MVVFLFTGYSRGSVGPEIGRGLFDVVLGGGVGRVFKCWREGDKGLGWEMLALFRCVIQSCVGSRAVKHHFVCYHQQ